MTFTKQAKLIIPFLIVALACIIYLVFSRPGNDIDALFVVKYAKQTLESLIAKNNIDRLPPGFNLWEDETEVFVREIVQPDGAH